MNNLIHLIKRNNLKPFWLLNCVFWISHWSIWTLISPEHTENLRNFSFHITYYIGPVFLSFALRYIYKKYSVHLLHFFYIIMIVLTLSIICGILWLIEQHILENLFFGKVTYNRDFNLLRAIWYKLYSFVMWSIIYLGLKVNEEFIIQKQNAERSLLLAKSSQLEMLKYQLNPHFLFNTLSSLRGLISSEPDKAKNMVTHISEFLRYSLHEGKNNEVTLFKEIEIIQQYLDIEKIRYNEDLNIEYDISPGSNDLIIPIFLIHPLVENAIKHGMQTSKLPLKVWIKTRIEDQTLFVDVKNSGKWIENESKGVISNTGTGLQNIQKRLVNAYPDKHSLNIIKENDFVQVVIAIKLESKYE